MQHHDRTVARQSRYFSTTAVALDRNRHNAEKTLGRHPRSITAPLAAFTMAILLASYCVSSIRAARREARYHPSSSSSTSSSRSHPPFSKMPLEESTAAGSSSGPAFTSAAWISKALDEERREKEKRK